MWKKGRTASRAAGASLWCSLLPRVLVISISAKSQIGRMIAAHSNFKGDEMQGGRVVKIKARHPWGDATVPADEVAEGLFSCALTGGPWEHSPTADPGTAGPGHRPWSRLGPMWWQCAASWVCRGWWRGREKLHNQQDMLQAPRWFRASPACRMPPPPGASHGGGGLLCHSAEETWCPAAPSLASCHPPQTTVGRSCRDSLGKWRAQHTPRLTRAFLGQRGAGSPTGVTSSSRVRNLGSGSQSILCSDWLESFEACILFSICFIFDKFHLFILLMEKIFNRQLNIAHDTTLELYTVRSSFSFYFLKC